MIFLLIGLWHVNQVAESMKVNQVVLIGDAPPNLRDLIIQGCQKYLGLNIGKRLDLLVPPVLIMK